MILNWKIIYLLSLSSVKHVKVTTHWRKKPRSIIWSLGESFNLTSFKNDVTMNILVVMFYTFLAFHLSLIHQTPMFMRSVVSVSSNIKTINWRYLEIEKRYRNSINSFTVPRLVNKKRLLWCSRFGVVSRIITPWSNIVWRVAT